MKKLIIAVIFFACITNVFAQTRAFNDIFPNIGANIRTEAFSSAGYARASQRASGFVIAGNTQGSRVDPQIVNNVLRRNPGYLVESIMVIPGNPGSVSLLNVYNALRNVRDLRGRLYDSATRNQPTPLFEEATRIVSERQTTAIADPPAASTLPRSETVYIRLKDANFGNTYYRAEMSLTANGLCYTMINFRNLSYLFVPVIREEKFIAQLYFEPIQEGVLIYSIAGIDVSDFFASRIHINSAISKRLTVINSWAIDGIRRNSR